MLLLSVVAVKRQDEVAAVDGGVDAGGEVGSGRVVRVPVDMIGDKTEQGTKWNKG